MTFQLKKPPIKPERILFHKSVLLLSNGQTKAWSEVNSLIKWPAWAVNPRLEVTPVDHCRGYDYGECDYNHSELYLHWDEPEDINIYNERLAKWAQQVMDYDKWSEEHKEEIKAAVAAKKDAKKNKKKKEISQKEKEIARLQKEIEKLRAK